MPTDISHIRTLFALHFHLRIYPFRPSPSLKERCVEVRQFNGIDEENGCGFGARPYSAHRRNVELSRQ